MSGPNGDVAIVGMACIFPGAADLQAYWQNIVGKVDAIGEPPDESWGAAELFDPDSTANDRVYCKRGGYLGDLARFDPMAFGVMPRTVDGGEPEQFLALQVAHAAFANAGYLDRPFNRERAAVILGRGTFLNRGNVTALQHGLVVEQTLRLLKQLHPEYSERELETLRQELKAGLPPFNAETAPGLVSNVMCGRIANRLDLRGPSYAVDAACASSLIATDLGVQELRSGRSDLALVGGVSVSTPAIVFMVFCQLSALSRRGEIRPFGADADGTLLGEGIGMVVLKRREDAERDGDRIYALIKGVGTSSDGRGLAVLAPRLEGEELALRRAYEAAGVSPESVELIEAHGTGTLVGDRTEVQALSRVFGPRDGALPTCAIGSVKSMISHTIPAAGIAGLIKNALALHERILPPTLHCEHPNPKLELEKTPFYLNGEPRPWIHGHDDPRRAGVSAFGFGGVNAHVVLEEYPDSVGSEDRTLLTRWDSEVFILQADSREGLLEAGEQLRARLDATPSIDLKDLAYSLNCPLRPDSTRLAIVAGSAEDLQKKLAHALKRLRDPGCTRIRDRGGVFYNAEPLGRPGGLAFLFPGEGSQYTGMLGDLCLHFPEIRACFDRADSVFLANRRELRPSQVVFPPPGTQSDETLWTMDYAVSAVFTADHALELLLRRLGIRPDAAVGHSSGEYAALLATGAMDVASEAQLLEHAIELNGICGAAEEQVPSASLLAVGATNADAVAAAVAESGGIIAVAMDNCPHQVVLCGPEAAIARARRRLEPPAICATLPFNRAYHTPLFQPVCEQLARFFDRVPLAPPRTPLYSCVTAQPYPDDPEAMRRLAVEQWIRPVRFRETVESMYANGIRLFVEVGPRANLTGFVDDTLSGRPHLAVASNVAARSGLTQLNFLVGQLASHGVAMDLSYLYARRAPRRAWPDVDAVADGRQAGLDRSIRLSLTLPRLSLPTEHRAAQTDGVRPRDVADHSPTGRGAASSARATSQPTAAGPAGAASSALTTAVSTPVGRTQADAPSSPESSSPAAAQPPVQPAPTPVPAPPSVPAWPAAPSPRPAARARVMEQYFRTMEGFLETERTLMTAFAARRSSVQRPPDTRTVAAHAARPAPSGSLALRAPDAGPFGLTILSLTPGQAVTAVCELDPDEHTFLRHHTIGGRPSDVDRSLTALPVMPLAMSLELMAEVAGLLSPGRRLVGMQRVRAQRWIAVEAPRRPIVIQATRVSAGVADELLVSVRDAGASDAPSDSGAAIVEGVVVLADAYRPPSAAALPPLRAPGTFGLTPERYYREVMFHGPAFQSVRSIDRCGEDGADATVTVPAQDDLFRSTPAPRLHTAPALLDAAGQVVGFWAAERLQRGFVIFPLGFESLEIYRLWPSPGAPVTCRARTAPLGEDRLRSDVELVDEQGQPIARLSGWEDLRFDFPRELVRFVLEPRESAVSRVWPAPIAPLPGADRFACCLLESMSDVLFKAEGAVWPTTWALVILSRRERELWAALPGLERRRREWLLGRWVAKDAVRRLVRERHGLTLSPADVEIVPGARGRPTVSDELAQHLGFRVALSIAHSGGSAVAIAAEGDACDGVGIDIEHVSRREAAVADLPLADAERAIISPLRETDRAEWLLRLWCAREAVAKALGRGIGWSPLNLALQELDTNTGRMVLTLAGELARQLLAHADRPLVAYTHREGDLVVATSHVAQALVETTTRELTNNARPV